MAFTLPALPFAPAALEPHIDAQTMQIHHDKHHQAYVDNLNKAIAGTPNENKSLEDLVKVAGTLSPAIRNNGGGHWNHSFFGRSWRPMPAVSQRENSRSPLMPISALLMLLKKNLHRQALHVLEAAGLGWWSRMGNW